MAGSCSPSLRRIGLALAASAALGVAGCGGGGGATTSSRSTATTSSAASTSGAAGPSDTATGATTLPATSVGSALEHQFEAVVRQVAPEVAQIQTDSGLGSGVILDTKGNIVTNAHVVNGANSISVTLADGRRFPARLVGSYSADDLAVVSIGSVGNLRAATLADSSTVQVGEIVLAAGNPLGLQSSITEGIVSAVGRTVSEGGGIVLPNSIQTSAPINPGNSGGALVDLQGQVIGIPTLAAGNPESGETADGIGFAIPSNIVRDIAGQLVKYGRVVDSHRAALGISAADGFGQPGVVIAAVQSGGPADRAGIRVGDTIESVAGTSVASADDLATRLATLKPGDKVKVGLLRQDGSHETVTVTLGTLGAG